MAERLPDGSLHEPENPDYDGNTAWTDLDLSDQVAPHLPKDAKKRTARWSEGLPSARSFMNQTHLEPQRDHKGIPRNIRKVRWPELFNNSRYSVDLIRTIYLANPPPADCESALREVIPYGHDQMNKPGEWSDPPPKYVVALHAAFPRPGLFELVNNPKHGPSYKLVSICQADPEDGKLPADINEKRWGHLRGRIGEFRGWFNKDDFAKIRYYGDRHEGVDTLNQRLDEGDLAREKEVNDFHSDYLEDFHDYHFRAIQKAANGGKPQWLHVTHFSEIVAENNAKKFYEEKREGYKIRVRRGSRMEAELRADREAAAVIHDVVAASPEKVKEQQNEAELQAAAKEINLGRNDPETRRRRQIAEYQREQQEIRRKKTM